MTSEHIISLLIEERDRLDAAIKALRGAAAPAKHAGAPAAKKAAAAVAETPEAGPKKRVLSAAGRKAIAAAAKKRWALIKAGKATSPFEGRKKKS
jgi:hypothetical protein